MSASASSVLPWFRYPLNQQGQFMVTWWTIRRSLRGTKVEFPTSRKFPTLDAAVAAAADLGPARRAVIMDCRVRLEVPRRDLHAVAHRRDHEWGEALRQAYGSQAGQARYDKRGTATPELMRLWSAKRDADRVAGL